MRQLITNVYILTMDQELTVYPTGYLIIEEDRIAEIGQMSELVYQSEAFAEVTDGEGGLLIPGLINTHTHLGMIPFRSLGDDVPDRLRRFLFPLEKFMTQELAVASGKYAMAEMQLAGVTTFFDMYYFADDLAAATVTMKSRGIIAETVINFPTCDSQTAHGGIDYSQNYLPKWLNHELVTPGIAPHAPNTNSEEALIAASQLARQYHVPLMIHLAEMDYEISYFAEKYDLTPVAYLEKIGFLGEHVVAAHCIFISEDDIQILKRTGTKVAHCLGANTKSAKGVAPLKALLAAGVPVGLGTDGPSSGNSLDLFCQMKLVGNMHKTVLKDRSAFPAVEILQLATNGGAEVLGMKEQIGSIEVGKKADLVLIETQSVNMFPLHDPYSVVVYSANSSNVETVWINGAVVVKHKELVGHNLKRLQQNLATEMTEFNHEVVKIMTAD